MLFLVGPTAVGKSEVALYLAPLINAEIIVADSMQVYRHLDIATAKPTPAEQKQIIHHCLDLVEPQDFFSAAQWLEKAQSARQQIEQRGKRALVVGGTGLYIRALRVGLDSNPPTLPQHQTQLAQFTLEELIEKIRHLQPEALTLIDIKNRRRVERAFTILQQGGTLQRDSWQKTSTSPIYGLKRDSEDLKNRINQRVRTMFLQGLEKEYETILKDKVPPNATAWQALGYRQIAAWKQGERDKMDFATCQQKIQQQTRQYAKRQMTWFKREKDIQWISVSAEEPAEMTAQKIYKNFIAS
ncbi:MAG: tRNA (adenosine(37)-N6)-dimethylallyltransferase MiaA [Verrucomicrobiae bacterium]|nr:tRNA (adenosine(37)-N6)-dimethylallyltransferase MiaA [Verrucomicrobiae bacterium]